MIKNQKLPHPKQNQRKPKEIWDYIQHLIIGDIATVTVKVLFLCLCFYFISLIIIYLFNLYIYFMLLLFYLQISN